MTDDTQDQRDQRDQAAAQAARARLQAQLGPDSPPVVLWMHDTVGCYGVDGDGREWSTWSGPVEVCAVCGAQIHGGYHTPGWLPDTPHTEATMAARHVCAEHVRTFRASRPR